MKLPRLFVLFSFVAVSALAQQSPGIIRATTLLDGRGQVLHDMQIVVKDGKIQRMEKAGGKPTFDLSSLTVLPGWIDVHDHITWHFGPNGHPGDKNETQEQAVQAEAANAKVTLLAGFTTVQSLGSPEDRRLRTAINGGQTPGPRLLTAVFPVANPKLTPAEIREMVRNLKKEGADVIKIFASKSIRDGGDQTFTNDQLQAAC